MEDSSPTEQPQEFELDIAGDDEAAEWLHRGRSVPRTRTNVRAEEDLSP